MVSIRLYADIQKEDDLLKKPIRILPIVLLCLLLTGCGTSEVTHPAGDYILELPYQSDFRILQLSDIHLGNKDNRALQYDFLNLTIQDAEADLIVLNGDLFTFADKSTARELFAFIDSYGIPWTVTFGNHDEQCYFSIDWLTGYLNGFGSNCLFRDLQDDDVFGSCNFAINLTQDGQVFEQIILMDSNRYYCGDYWGYDYIKENQIGWYERIVTYTAEQNVGIAADSILFFHIPFPEFSDAWDAAQAGSPDAVWEYGEKNEEVCSPEYNSGLFDRILALDSTRAVLVAHDHVNDYRIRYRGVYLSYGVNSTDRIYYQDGMLGGQVLTIRTDHSLSFEPIFHTYSEVHDE